MRACAIRLPNRFIALITGVQLLGLVALISGEVASAAPPWASGAPHSDFAFCNRLHDRQLYRLAAAYCRSRLQRSALDDELRRAAWVGRLLDSLTMQAVNAGVPSENENWRVIQRTRQTYGDKLNSNIARAHVDLHYQLAQLWRATWQQSVALASSDTEAALRQADRQFRDVADGLETIRQLIDRRQTGSQTLSPAEQLTVQQLRNRVRFKLAETYRRHADNHPDGSPDRVYLLTQALRHFGAIARLTPKSTITWESRLGEIECQRLLGKLDTAKQLLQTFPVQDLDSSLRRKITVETAAWLVAVNRPDQAAKLLASELQRKLPNESGELRAKAQLTLIRAYMEAAKRANQEQTESGLSAATWQSLAVELLDQMEENQTAYWVRQAQALLTARRQVKQVPSDIEILAKRAENLFQREQFDKAVETFRYASNEAAKLGLDDRAFELAFQAAAVLHQTQQHAKALTAFRDLARSRPAHPKAAQAHWLAVLQAATLARQDSQWLSQYEQLLVSQLKQWSSDRRSETAAIWLAKLRQRQGQPGEAIALLRRVTPECAQSSEAVAQLHRLYMRILTTSERTQAQRIDLAKRANQDFQKWASPSRRTADDPVAKASDAERAEALVAAAKIALLFGDPASSFAVQAIRGGTFAKRAAPFDPNQVAAIVGLEKLLSEQTNTMQSMPVSWNRVDWESIDWVVPLLRRLEKAITSTSSNDARLSSQLIQQQYRLVEHLSQLATYREDPGVQQIRVAALVRQGKRSEAVAVLSRLLKNEPDNASLYGRIAVLWEENGSQASLQQALDAWRSAARYAKKESDAWYEAKLGIARVLVALGKRKRAQDSINLLQALHPDLGGQKYRKAFLELLSE